jgi:hypothetical protein
LRGYAKASVSPGEFGEQLHRHDNQKELSDGNLAVLKSVLSLHKIYAYEYAYISNKTGEQYYTAFRYREFNWKGSDHLHH